MTNEECWLRLLEATARSCPNNQDRVELSKLQPEEAREYIRHGRVGCSGCIVALALGEDCGRKGRKYAGLSRGKNIAVDQRV